MAEITVQDLLFEREGYVLRGLPDRVAQVDAELAKFGVGVEDAPDAPEVALEPPEVETATPKAPRRRKATA